MNPTQNQDNTGPDPRPFGDGFLAGLFTEKDRFAAWVASATGTAAQRVPGPETSPVLGLPMTDADRRRYALREAGYTGWVDDDGNPRTEAEFTAWSAFMSKARSGYVRDVAGGWCLTEFGRAEFGRLSVSAQYELAEAWCRGVSLGELRLDYLGGQPLFEWLSDRDADGAESYGERLAERYLAQTETTDAAEVGYRLTDAGHDALSATAPQRYDCCECCGGPFAFGPSLHPTCAMCSEGDGQPLAASESTCPVDLVTETDDETTARVLRSAATYLERHGWIQGAYYDATSGVFTPAACLVGAIGMVCYGGPVDAPAQHFDDPGFLNFEAAVLHLDRYLLAENGSESYEFNDARGRRLEDVTHVLRDAATRPAHELVDALKAIDQQNADLAALTAMLIPGGAFAEGESEPVDYANGCTCADAIANRRGPCADCPGWQHPNATAEGGDPE